MKHQSMLNRLFRVCLWLLLVYMLLYNAHALFSAGVLFQHSAGNYHMIAGKLLLPLAVLAGVVCIMLRNIYGFWGLVGLYAFNIARMLTSSSFAEAGFSLAELLLLLLLLKLGKYEFSKS